VSLLSRQAPSHWGLHKSGVRLHFLLANEKKISYTVRLGFLAMAKATMRARLVAPVGGRKGSDPGKTKAGMSRKTKGMPVYDRSIKVLLCRTNGVGPGDKLGFKTWTSEPTAQGEVEFRFKRATDRNEPNRLKFWWVSQIHGFRRKQTQAMYPPFYQLDTAKLGPFFEKFECGLRTID